MHPWIPHIHRGGSSDQCTKDDDSGREGFYFAVCWLGWMLGLTLTSRRWEHRLIAELRAKRESGQ
jgi:hypothetical protein